MVAAEGWRSSVGPSMAKGAGTPPRDGGWPMPGQGQQQKIFKNQRIAITAEERNSSKYYPQHSLLPVPAAEEF